MSALLSSRPPRGTRRHARITCEALWIATALAVLVPSAADPDLWGHLFFGRQLLAGTLPATNGYAYTAPAHPWINHELVAELVMAGAFDRAGAIGLIALKVALGLATLVLVRRVARRRSGQRSAAAVATAVSAAVMAPGLMIRPQLFTLLFLALSLDLLATARHRPTGSAWLLPPLAVVWVNTHGGVLAGVGLAALALLGTLAARVARGAAGGRAAAGVGALIAALGVALLLNPYGAELVRFLATEVTPRVPITEWAPVQLGDASFPLFKATALGLVLWAVAARRLRAAEALVAGAALAAALLHRRHIPLFAVAAAPLIAAALVDAAARLRRRGDLATVAPWRAPAPRPPLCSSSRSPPALRGAAAP